MCGGSEPWGRGLDLAVVRRVGCSLDLALLVGASAPLPAASRPAPAAAFEPPLLPDPRDLHPYAWPLGPADDRLPLDEFEDPRVVGLGEHLSYDLLPGILVLEGRTRTEQGVQQPGSTSTTTQLVAIPVRTYEASYVGAAQDELDCLARVGSRGLMLPGP